MQGIYAIKNTVNNKIYVGQALNIENRWLSHKKDLKANKHRNIHLQRAFNKFNIDIFEFYVLEKVENINLLTEKEQFWINRLKTLNREFGYNMKEAGDGGKLTEEVKEKISNSHKGKILSEETKKKISESKRGSIPWNKGKKMDEEYSKILSERFSGQTPWNKGRTLSDETKDKISKSRKGKPVSFKIPEDQYSIIMEKINNKEKISVIAKEYGVTVQTIYNVKNKSLLI